MSAKITDVYKVIAEDLNGEIILGQDNVLVAVKTMLWNGVRNIKIIKM